MTSPLEVDVDDITGCPLAPRCEGCGTARGLTVRTTISDEVGATACVTVCIACEEKPAPPGLLLDDLTRCRWHAEHLGIPLELVQAAMDRVTSGP